MARMSYEDLLAAASDQEKRVGNLQLAVEFLNKAEKRTNAYDELYHLRAWRDRLLKDIEKKAQPKQTQPKSKS